MATLLLVPLLVWHRQRNPARGAARRRATGGGSPWPASCGQVLAQLGMTWGIHRSLASNGAMLNLLIPVISAVLASIMLGERLIAAAGSVAWSSAWSACC